MFVCKNVHVSAGVRGGQKTCFCRVLGLKTYTTLPGDFVNSYRTIFHRFLETIRQPHSNKISIDYQSLFLWAVTKRFKRINSLLVAFAET